MSVALGARSEVEVVGGFARDARAQRLHADAEDYLRIHGVVQIDPLDACGQDVANAQIRRTLCRYRDVARMHM